MYYIKNMLTCDYKHIYAFMKASQGLFYDFEFGGEGAMARWRFFFLYHAHFW